MTKKQVGRRAVRLISILILLLCEACSMKQDQATVRSLEAVVPHIEYKIPHENIRHEKLENGMNVLMMKDATVPQVLMQIGYEVGSADENGSSDKGDGGERGYAHLLEHMVFKGTQKMKEGDIDSIARKYGASFNAFTSQDMTSYYFEVDKNNWKVFLEVMADCMKNVRFDENHLASELHAVVQELKMYKDHHVRRMIVETSGLIFPAHHPYHHPIIGYKEDLTSVSAEKLQDFYKKYYHPERATLLVMGDINFDDVMQEVHKQFGDIPYSKSPERKKFPVLTPELTVHNTVINEVVQKKRTCFYWAIPGVKQVSVEMLSMIAYALGGGEGSRLYKRLVDDLQIADSVSVDPYLLLEAGTFLIIVEPKPDTMDECRQEIVLAMQDFIKHGITDEEMQKTIVSESSSFFKLLTDLNGLAYEWLVSFYATKDPKSLFTKIDALYDVKKSDVQMFAKKYLDPFLMSQISILPVPEDKKQIWQEAKESSDAVDKEILSTHVRKTPLEEPEFVHTLDAPNKLSFEFPKPAADYMLENGLSVLTYNRDQVPLVHAGFIFKDTHMLGNILEGVAVDCMMSMLIEGSREYSKDQLVTYFETAGADYHFSTGDSSLSCFTDGFESLFKMFVHVLRYPSFDADALEKVKAQMVESYIRTQDSHISVGRKALKNAMYKGHPYEWTFDEAIAMIKTLTVEDMDRLHKKYVRPDRMILCVAGASGNHSFDEIVERVCSNWQSEGALEMSEQISDERHFVAGERKDIHMLRDQGVLLMGQPSELDLYHEDYVPVKILNLICFHSLGSRIYALREKTGLFYNAGGAFAAGADKQKGYDFALAIVNPENLDQAEEKIKATLVALQQEGVTEKELEEARQIYLKGLIDATSSVGHIAAMLSNEKALDLPFDYYDKVLERVQSISVEELNAIAKKYADPSLMMTVRVGRV